MRKNDSSTPARVISPGVGFQGMVKLDQFATLLHDVYPDALGVFHVGSSLYGKAFRDVDVRVMLRDEDWQAEFGPDNGARWRNPKYRAVCLAFTTLGEQMTGMPIDCQIDPAGWANEHHAPSGGFHRSALGTRRPETTE